MLNSQFLRISKSQNVSIWYILKEDKFLSSGVKLPNSEEGIAIDPLESGQFAAWLTAPFQQWARDLQTEYSIKELFAFAFAVFRSPSPVFQGILNFCIWR